MPQNLTKPAARNDIWNDVWDNVNNLIRVDSSGGSSGNVGLVNFSYDYVNICYPSSTQEEYLFYEGGITGTLQATITIVYEDAKKRKPISVTKT